MTVKKVYQLSRYGNLLLLRGVVGGRDNQEIMALKFLVDTGSTYTTLPVQVLENLSYDTQNPVRNLRITAASSIIEAPVIAVSWLNCLGTYIEDFSVVAYTLPKGTFWQGILGMDFLISCQAIISVKEGTIRTV